MENASKALLIAGAILLCILIIAIGMFIYNSAQGTIIDSLNSLSTQQIESFNNQFVAYQGFQKGVNVKKLLRMLIFYADPTTNKYKRPVGLTFLRFDENKDYDALYGNIEPPSDIQKSIDQISKVIPKIKSNHEYYVSFCYNKSGLINYILIFYEANIDPNKHPIIHTK